MKILFRLLGLPFMTILVVIGLVKHSLVFLWNYLIYGGEILCYEKDTKVTMIDIYDMLKARADEK